MEKRQARTTSTVVPGRARSGSRASSASIPASDPVGDGRIERGSSGSEPDGLSPSVVGSVPVVLGSPRVGAAVGWPILGELPALGLLVTEPEERPVMPLEPAPTVPALLPVLPLDVAEPRVSPL